MLIHNKDDIEFVTEFPCFLGHPVAKQVYSSNYFLHLRIYSCKENPYSKIDNLLIDANEYLLHS